MTAALARLLDRLPGLRLAYLLAGTTAIGVGLALLLRARLGLPPLDVLHLGTARALGMTLGGGIIVVQLLLLVTAVAIRARIGFGTVAGFLVPAGVVDLTTLLLGPPVQSLPVRIAFLVGGGALMCLGAAVYLAAALGMMPRDGIMLKLGGTDSRRIALARIALDLGCVGLGMALARPAVALGQGVVGPGTIVLAVASGPVIAWLLPRIQRHLSPNPTAEPLRAEAP